MSIQPDHWIRKMSLEHGMIEPFVDGQVRQGNISYGLSSYGYDIRVASEFKIFTNVNNAIVDPKNFTSDSFVNFVGDVCIIPPNSFALAKTVEYFRIPRDVLTICVGKSTYARCFSGDTKVALVDGTAISLEEMARRSDDGELFFGYSISQFGRVMVTLLENPRYIGRDALIEITLDNGEKIKATPDHEFVMRDGQMRQADQLRENDALMPLYRQLARGYEMVYQPSNGHLFPTHRLADEWNLRHGIYSEQADSHRHHKDFNRQNNNPWNIERLKENPDWYANYGEAQRTPSLNFLNFPVDLNSTNNQELHFYPNIWKDATDHSNSRRSVGTVSTFSGDATRYRNHRVVSVRPLEGDHDVYCLTVPEAGNFALEAGVFTSNCGLIVNVTPFEPCWEGFVTLEISNTTPLPAKVYANEGIAQVLFFRADEECEISYADRKGKYQAQQGIVLPKV